MSYKRYSLEFKTDVLLAYEKRECTVKELCTYFNINEDSLSEWMKLYEKYGIEGLQRSTTWKPYSKALKEAAVNDYLSGEYSQRDLVEKYEISSRSVLQRWINHYTSHRELKDTSKGRTSSMAKGRKKNNLG